MSASGPGNPTILSADERSELNAESPPTSQTIAPTVIKGEAALRRRVLRASLLLLVPIIVSALAAFAGASQMETIYAAQSDVILDLGERPDVLEKYLATQAVIAKSRATLAPVSRSLDIPVETLERNLTVDFPKGGVVMRLQYADQSAETALLVVKLIVDDYVKVLDGPKFRDSSKDILVPAFILEKPIWPRPSQAAAIGAAVGLAIAIAALAIASPLRAGA